METIYKTEEEILKMLNTGEIYEIEPGVYNYEIEPSEYKPEIIYEKIKEEEILDKKICPECKGGKMRTRKYCSKCWKEIRQERKQGYCKECGEMTRGRYRLCPDCRYEKYGRGYKDCDDDEDEEDE
jgi:hypothetical protein